VTQHRLRALVGATLLCACHVAPVRAETCTPTAEAAQPAKPKKKGFGLGGILKAAKNAGVGDLLGAGNVLGDGKAAQVAGVVAGTAVAASDGASANVAQTVVGLAGAGRVAQIAGAATGTAAELARTGSPLAAGRAAPKPCAPAPAAAPAASTWN
jgi:hypothetical protein